MNDLDTLHAELLAARALLHQIALRAGIDPFHDEAQMNADAICAALSAPPAELREAAAFKSDWACPGCGYLIGCLCSQPPPAPSAVDVEALAAEVAQATYDDAGYSSPAKAAAAAVRTYFARLAASAGKGVG